MSVELKKLDLKAINAHKRKLTWGDVPTIYHLLSGSIGELDGILTHGFSNNFTELLNKKKWNLALLGGQTDTNGEIKTQIKPQIALKHYFHESHYELHCYPIVNGEKLYRELIDDPDCPFLSWSPKISKKLFRINSLLPFIAYSLSKGDEADMQLTRFAYLRVEELINTLRESFDIIEIQGYNIAQFYRALIAKKQEYTESNSANVQHSTLISELLNSQNENVE